uniref:Bowman-Birk serine protease inhibitors family domain-containing protein n=1 Tax=Salix viminalis TaxID=40686 RepID=A0A6N2KHA3_SALVM
MASMKFLGITWMLVFVMVPFVQASTRISLLVSSINLGPPSPQFVTVAGCNNDCDTACCNCDIKKQPPLCVQCCQEER